MSIWTGLTIAVWSIALLSHTLILPDRSITPAVAPSTTSGSTKSRNAPATAQESSIPSLEQIPPLYLAPASTTSPGTKPIPVARSSAAQFPTHRTTLWLRWTSANAGQVSIGMPLLTLVRSTVLKSGTQTIG